MCPDPDVCAIGATYLRALGVAYLFQTFSTALSTVLSSTERVKLPLVASIASILTNTGLNWFLIYGHGRAQTGRNGRGGFVRGRVDSQRGGASDRMHKKQKNIAVTHIDRMFHWSGDFVREYFYQILSAGH